MKNKFITLVVVLVGGVLCLNAQKNTRPNVIVVLADDIGTGDISEYRKLHSNNIILETPNIDKLAQRGVMFTNAHAPAALCATSRYGIMTGNGCHQSPLPWGIWSSYAPSAFTSDQLTLGRLMQKADYNTGFFGKWHLGMSFPEKGNPNKIYKERRGKAMELDVDITKIVAGGPNYNGFDYSFTLPAGVQDVPYAVYENSRWLPLEKDSKIDVINREKMAKLHVKLDKDEGLGDSNWDPHNIGPLLANKGVSFIKKNANKSKPFFMYYCSQAVHKPHTPSKELNGVKIAGTTPSKHMDMIKELDVQVGMLIEQLKKEGVYENTVFVFTSDNGGLLVDKNTAKSGHKVSDIYRGAKNQPYEGGHRVPFIVSWPKELKNNIVHKPALGLDIMATLAAITHTKIDKGQAVDSYNLLPILKNPKSDDIHSFLIVQGGAGKQGIIIEGDWKLIVNFDKKDKTWKNRIPVSLFNLKENIGEKESGNHINNPKYKEKVKELFDKYNHYRDTKEPTGKHI
ncbi:arylsulfatase A-like enzyme [Wenyingzhuangia heitensis]|uniref:Arylsulfatase A-like enzyme n=1 Tax=Wenyingzhuangia heitensis TaxID=1487859 RepID=A0ABX0UAQ4_9FLAO|nr:arylsulfatase [Wenyingzhuangia heitensis]NIJ45904.1 arylsulfatase A-like enzyme [Wenyingzhuangia heitensis]